jgi:hypothetical protein
MADTLRDASAYPPPAPVRVPTDRFSNTGAVAMLCLRSIA